MRNFRTLELLLNKEIDKYKVRCDVIGIGVLGSLARGDPWQCSDIDLVVLLRKAEKDFFMEFDDQEGTPVDVVCITAKYAKAQPYISSLFGCKVVYDPMNLLSEEVKKTNNAHFSGEEILRRNQVHKDQAERFLEKANYSLEEHDFPSAVEHSRQAVLSAGMIAVEKSCHVISHHRRIAKYLASFQAVNRPRMSSRFLKALRLMDADEKISREYDRLVRRLFRNGYPWIHKKLEEKVAPEWMDWTRNIPLHSALSWRILPIYKIGHLYSDFLDKVIDEFEEFARAVFEVNHQKYDEVTLVFEALREMDDKPLSFSQMFSDALRARNLTYNKARRIVNESTDFVNSITKMDLQRI